MNWAWDILFGLLVVASSAMATYAISISRERLWLRSKKSEELYSKTEECYFELSRFFRERYDLVEIAIHPHKTGDLRKLNRQLAGLSILVGLYFPTLDANLAAVLAAISTALDWLARTEASDESNRERALEALDFAVGNVKDSIDQLKHNILRVGRVDRIGRFSDIILHRGHRAQSERVFTVAT